MPHSDKPKRSYIVYLVVGALLLLTFTNILIIKYRQKDLSGFSGSELPRIVELDQCPRRSFSQTDVSAVVTKILETDMKPPVGVKPVDKKILSESQLADLHDAIASFLITYQSPMPETVYDYYIINRGGTKMREASIEIAEQNIERLKMSVDRSKDQTLMYIKVYWNGLGQEMPEKLNTHWQNLLYGEAACMSCVWETSAPLSDAQREMNRSDRDIFGHTSNSAVFFECNTNPENLLQAKKKVLFADIRFAIELDQEFEKEIVTFARRYWYNEESDKWFPYDSTSLVVPSKCNYHPFVMF